LSQSTVPSSADFTQQNGSSSSFLQDVEEATLGDTRLMNCIQCGTCGGSCPSAADMNYTPRELFQMIKANQRGEVLSANTFWYCVSCYFCTVRCPQDIPITEIMYSLKRMAIQAGLYRKSSVAEAPDFSETYIDLVENYGRSFELGLATRYHLRHHPLEMVKMAPLGLEMLRRNRMDLTPRRIKGIKKLRAILKRARQLGETA